MGFSRRLSSCLAAPMGAILPRVGQQVDLGARVVVLKGHGRTVAVHDRIARAVHQGGYADVLLRPTMVGILRCGKMLPPQLNLVIEIEFANATTALWSENAGAHPAGATLSTDFEIQNVRVLASQVVLDSALVESFNRAVQRPKRRGGAQRHRGARLHETQCRPCS